MMASSTDFTLAAKSQASDLTHGCPAAALHSLLSLSLVLQLLLPPLSSAHYEILLVSVADFRSYLFLCRDLEAYLTFSC